jgi:YopX protein.
MEFKTRKIKFKAWDTEHKLLMRLTSIESLKGELFKKNHILLQFTGLYDQDGEEIYDRDILLISLEKYVVFWNDVHNGWFYSPLKNSNTHSPLLSKEAERTKRFCNYYEMQKES